MKLFHATSEENAQRILERGFAVSHVRDSAGRSWLSSTPTGAAETSSGKASLVIVELPDDVARAHRYLFEDGEQYLGNYLVPWEVLNSYRPFQSVPISVS